MVVLLPEVEGGGGRRRKKGRGGAKVKGGLNGSVMKYCTSTRRLLVSFRLVVASGKPPILVFGF